MRRLNAGRGLRVRRAVVGLAGLAVRMGAGAQQDKSPTGIGGQQPGRHGDHEGIGHELFAGLKILFEVPPQIGPNA